MKMNTTEDARHTLAQIKQKLAAASARAIALQTERQRLSFDANTGDEIARERLDRANAASTAVTIELENLRSAAEEGKRRLDAAEHADRSATRSRLGLSSVAPVRVA